MFEGHLVDGVDLLGRGGHGVQGTQNGHIVTTDRRCSVRSGRVRENAGFRQCANGRLAVGQICAMGTDNRPDLSPAALVMAQILPVYDEAWSRLRTEYLEVSDGIW